jgi:hypothetical protein
MARALHSLSHLPLLAGRNAGLAAGAQFATIRNKLAQELNVLVVNQLGITDDDFDERPRAALIPATTTAAATTTFALLFNFVSLFRILILIHVRLQTLVQI